MLRILSFGYKHAPPPEADMVMDVRFLQNPFWVEDLKPGTGRDEKVGDYIESDPAFAAFLADLENEIGFLLEKGGDKTLAVGCTGGRHRSVYVVERLAEILRGKSIGVTVEHRDIDR